MSKMDDSSVPMKKARLESTDDPFNDDEWGEEFTNDELEAIDETLSQAEASEWSNQSTDRRKIGTLYTEQTNPTRVHPSVAKPKVPPVYNNWPSTPKSIVTPCTSSKKDENEATTSRFRRYKDNGTQSLAKLRGPELSTSSRSSSSIAMQLELEKLSNEKIRLQKELLAKAGESDFLRGRLENSKREMQNEKLERAKALEEQSEFHKQELETIRTRLEKAKTDLNFKNQELADVHRRCQQLETKLKQDIPKTQCFPAISLTQQMTNSPLRTNLLLNRRFSFDRNFQHLDESKIEASVQTETEELEEKDERSLNRLNLESGKDVPGSRILSCLLTNDDASPTEVSAGFLSLILDGCKRSIVIGVSETPPSCSEQGLSLSSEDSGSQSPSPEEMRSPYLLYDNPDYQEECNEAISPSRLSVQAVQRMLLESSTSVTPECIAMFIPVLRYSLAAYRESVRSCAVEQGLVSTPHCEGDITSSYFNFSGSSSGFDFQVSEIALPDAEVRLVSALVAFKKVISMCNRASEIGSHLVVNSRKFNPMDEDSMEEDSMKEDSMKEDSMKEDSMKEDSMKEDSMKEDSMEEDSMEEDAVEEEPWMEESFESYDQMLVSGVEDFDKCDVLENLIKTLVVATGTQRLLDNDVIGGILSALLAVSDIVPKDVTVTKFEPLFQSKTWAVCLHPERGETVISVCLELCLTFLDVWDVPSAYYCRKIKDLCFVRHLGILCIRIHSTFSDVRASVLVQKILRFIWSYIAKHQRTAVLFQENRACCSVLFLNCLVRMLNKEIVAYVDPVNALQSYILRTAAVIIHKYVMIDVDFIQRPSGWTREYVRLMPAIVRLLKGHRQHLNLQEVSALQDLAHDVEGIY